MTPEAAIIESMFMIADKEGEDVPFVLNATQRALDNELTGRDIIPKARQEGVSSYFLGRYSVRCMSKRNTRAVVISHDRESTERMLNKVRYFIENIRGPQPEIHRDSAHEISFPKTNSMFYIGTAGARKFGRGDTISHLHMSEYAFWDNPEHLISGLTNAVPMSGEIAIESTGNGQGNDYHKRCVRAYEGGSAYKCHFFNWIDFPEYTLDIDDDEAAYIMANIDEDLEEHLLVDILTPGQFAWRRMKLDEMNYDLGEFKAEFPLTFDECFQSVDRSIFYKVRMVPTRDWLKVDRNLHVLKDHPIVGHVYSLGADVSGGVGEDRSVIEIFDVTFDGEQVAEWVNDKIGPDIFAGKVATLGTMFNQAFLTVENNNHGIVTLDVLRNIYDPDMIYMNEGKGREEDHLLSFGYRTSSRTKPLIIGRLRKELATTVTIHSPLLKAELNSFVEHENGTLGAVSGSHDDRVIASAMGVMGFERAGLFKGTAFPDGNSHNEPARDPFSLNAIIKEMHHGKGDFPISPQHVSQRR